ncbi:MAG: hypothetical protein AAB907_03090 [Patescibacteria group bacterium]
MNSNLENITRRVAFAVGAGAVSTVWATHELRAENEGIETPTGVFIPLYEDHRYGIQRLPDDIDGLFRELSMSPEIYNAPPQNLLRAEGDVSFLYTDYHTKLFPDRVLSQIAKSGIIVIFGDVKLPFPEASNILSYMTPVVTTASFMALKEKAPEKKSRRRLLQGGATAGLLWGASDIAPKNIARTASLLDTDSPAYRIFTRLNGSFSHIHPENDLIFFRNALVAEKLLFSSKLMKDSLGKKPKIGFNFGLLHSGIEDFLRAGQEVCRAVITAYPNFYLQRAVELQGSLDNFCAVRMIGVPKDFSRTSSEADKQVTDKKAYDIELKRQLLLKFTS